MKKVLTIALSLLLFIPATAGAVRLCAVQEMGSVQGNYISPGDGNLYGPAFTVSETCDVTGITLNAGTDGTNDTWAGAIWDTSGNVLVTGGNATANTTWNTCTVATSTVAAGTYTLQPATTYYVGYAADAGSHVRGCMSTTGTLVVKYYPAGGPWTAWVTAYPPFQVWGSDAAAAAPAFSTDVLIFE